MSNISKALLWKYEITLFGFNGIIISEIELLHAGCSKKITQNIKYSVKIFTWNGEYFINQTLDNVTSNENRFYCSEFLIIIIL